MTLKKVGSLILSSIVAMTFYFSVQAADTVKIALVEPYSGPVAAVGLEVLDAFEYTAEVINKRGGVLGGRHIEIVPLDNAMQAEKTTQQIKKAIDQGIRFLSQGVGSNHALNIIKQLNKHNKRNPDKSILFLNHSAVTTAFTNELCSFWHFRFDANVDMKVAALTAQMSKDSKVKNVYMVNQNYAYGKSFQAAGRKFLKDRTPQAKLVGDDLIVPFGKVKDFTPYVAKLKSTGTDTVLTGNWGADLARFVKAVAAAGLDVQFYTIYAGIPSAMNQMGAKDGMAVKIKQLSELHMNDENRSDIRNFANSYKAKYKRTWYADRQRYVIEMFAAALNKAGSDDPKAVAYALEGLEHQGANGEMMVMRAKDHQIQLPMVISQMSSDVNEKFVYNDNTFPVAWKTTGWVDKATASLPTTCEMKRP